MPQASLQPSGETQLVPFPSFFTVFCAFLWHPDSCSKAVLLFLGKPSTLPFSSYVRRPLSPMTHAWSVVCLWPDAITTISTLLVARSEGGREEIWGH